MDKRYTTRDYPDQRYTKTDRIKKRIDLQHEKTGTIIEVKSEDAGSKAFIRKQIQKDHYILQHSKKIKKVVRHAKTLVTYY